MPLGPRVAGRPTGQEHPPRRWVILAGWLVVGLCAGFACAVALVPVGTPSPARDSPTIFYDRHGTEVGSAASGGVHPTVALSQIPEQLQQATISVEDASFYANFGVNPVSIVRAAWVDLRARRLLEGGSTITQQLAKNLYLTQSRTWRRKLEELVYTFRIEATRSKAEILASYLNNIYYGEGAWGVGQAAQTYFGQDVSTLDLAECALLAGLPASPQTLDPYQHPAAAHARQQWVLERMVATGAISPQQAAAAAAETLHYHRAQSSAPVAGYFLQYVLASIGQHSPALEAAVQRGGYRVYTTLDSSVQAAADRAMAQYLPPGTPDASGALQPQGALVAIDPGSGAVRALVGGRSVTQDPFNRALYAVRQPGSTFKAFLYATVIDEGYPITARQFDGPVSYPGADGQPYVVKDVEPYLLRELTMREALAISSNVVAVKWAQQVGPARVIATARRMGITSPLQPTLPLVLGSYGVTPLELADAYVPLASLGTAHAPWCVERVVAPDGAVVWAPPAPRGRRALDPGVAYIVTSMMESVMTDGTGRALLPIVGRQVAGKTGSTNGNRDAWFVGYTPNLVAAVWVGDDQPADLHGVGATLAGPVWAHFMAQALQGQPDVVWRRPADVEEVRVSALDGLLPNPTSPTVVELFLRGHQPTTMSPIWGATQASPGLIGIPGSQVMPAPPDPLAPPGVLPVVP